MIVSEDVEQIDAVRTAIKQGNLRASFSQLGEDGVLWWIFNDCRDGFYVDVGCHHPFRFSNTAGLHIFNNWRGINIDVDERAIAAFEKERPEDINLCLAVGEKASWMEVTLFEEGAVNSFDPGAASNPAWAHLVRERRMVKVMPLKAILDEHLPPAQRIDFLNVDAEGLDYDILTSNDWHMYNPDTIAVEVHNFNLSRPHEDRTFQLLTEQGYQLISHVVVKSIYRKQ